MKSNTQRSLYFEDIPLPLLLIPATGQASGHLSTVLWRASPSPAGRLLYCAAVLSISDVTTLRNYLFPETDPFGLWRLRADYEL